MVLKHEEHSFHEYWFVPGLTLAAVAVGGQPTQIPGSISPRRGCSLERGKGAPSATKPSATKGYLYHRTSRTMSSHSLSHVSFCVSDSGVPLPQLVL